MDSASNIIFLALTDQLSNNATTEEIDILLDKLFKGSDGRDVQLALLEVCVALQRNANANYIHQFLGHELTYIKDYIFRSVDKFGLTDGALNVLKDRISGPEGFIETTKEEYMVIRANIKHLEGSADDLVARYWRLRVKSFKNRLLSELKAFIHAANISVDSASDVFSTSLSRSMNKVLAMKKIAEEYQDILIEHHMNVVALSLPEISLLNASEVVKDHTFANFLSEAAEQSSEHEFHKRLQAFIRRAPKLRLFEYAYNELSFAAGIHWPGIQHAADEFRSDIDDALEEYYKQIENLIEVLDYADLPEDFPAEELTKPFLEITEKAISEIKAHSDKWQKSVNFQRRTLQENLYLIQ